MSQLTKQELLKTINLINNKDKEILEKSALDFVKDLIEDLNNLILNVTNEENQTIIEFITLILTSWNNLSYENQAYGNLLFKNIIINDNKTVIIIYETDEYDNIKKITTLTLLI